MNHTPATSMSGLRAKERVIKRLADGGMSESDIAWRFKSSPGHIQRTLRLIEVPRRAVDEIEPSTTTTTAIERTVIKARRRGVSHAEIGARLRRSPGFVARVERYAALRDERGEAS